MARPALSLPRVRGTARFAQGSRHPGNSEISKHSREAPRHDHVACPPQAGHPFGRAGRLSCLSRRTERSRRPRDRNSCTESGLRSQQAMPIASTHAAPARRILHELLIVAALETSASHRTHLSLALWLRTHCSPQTWSQRSSTFQSQAGISVCLPQMDPLMHLIHRSHHRTVQFLLSPL